MRVRPFPLAASLLACIAGYWLSAGVGLAEESAVIMTYNIRYENTGDGEDVWSNRRETVIETLRSAEIVGLQEVVLSQYEAIREAMPEWGWEGVGREDGKDKGEFSPIGFRTDRFKKLDGGTFWLSEQPDTVGSQGWDAALPRIATWVLLQVTSGDARLLVVNTHFDHRGVLAREHSGALVASRVDAMAQDVPVVAMGDLNAKPLSKPLTQIMSGNRVPLRDARESSRAPAQGPTGTWNGFKQIDPQTRIDHVLVSDRVEVESYEVLDPRTPGGRFASDHLPVMVKVTF